MTSGFVYILEELTYLSTNIGVGIEPMTSHLSSAYLGKRHCVQYVDTQQNGIKENAGLWYI